MRIGAAEQNHQFVGITFLEVNFCCDYNSPEKGFKLERSGLKACGGFKLKFVYSSFDRV